jgi:hypothetical protein
MPLVINNTEFSGFPGNDSQHLQRLNYRERVQWLHYRFQLVFLEPFRTLLGAEAEGTYVWLCVTSLACTAIQALSNFEFQGSDQDKFTRFVEEHFQTGTFSRFAERLDDPRPGRDIAQSAAEHLYKYFRNGLAHSFCIEWGGLQHREEIAIGPEYLFRAETGPGMFSLGVVPREFFVDFLASVDAYFHTLAGRDDAAPQTHNFNRCFERTFLVKDRRPLP